MKYVLLLAAMLLMLTACTSEENRIKEEIEEAKYCTTDNDCIIVQSKCPFDCYQAVNKAEAERINQRIKGFESSCTYSCVPIKGTACESGRCVVVMEK
jgi:hypothetical protein